MLQILPPISNYSGAGIVTTHFETTPPTPTYLIAFVVSDFLYRNNSMDGGFPHATYARPNAIHGASYSVEIGAKILKAFDDYITIPFSHALPKMDQVAVPDFAAGNNLRGYGGNNVVSQYEK